MTNKTFLQNKYWSKWLEEKIDNLFVHIYIILHQELWDVFYMLSLNLSPGAALWVKLPYHTCECTSVYVPWPSSLYKTKPYEQSKQCKYQTMQVEFPSLLVLIEVSLIKWAIWPSVFSISMEHVVDKFSLQ